jgi:hypothetical protein
MARNYYQQAANNGANTYYNLGVFDVKSGNYSSATTNSENLVFLISILP